jgi:hypothetical protein
MSARRYTRCALLLAVGLPLAALAQTPAPMPLRDGIVVEARAGHAGSAPVALAPASAAVADVMVQLARSVFVADGVTRVPVRVELRDARGQRLSGRVPVTIESGARVLLDGAATDETGPGALDADRVTPGVQFEAVDGRATFWLLAPPSAQDVRLRVTAGAATAEGVVRFDAELREMLAVGLVEGVISLSRKRPGDIQPVRLEDGFEEELRSWSSRFSDDRGRAGVRGALFLKGRIRGDALLTLAYDSERDERRNRLLTDVRPDEYYPVYGDASIKGDEAPSASKLYVRIDKDRHFLLYGDFQTAATFVPASGGRLLAPVRQRDLGQYSRTLTGVQGRYEIGARPGEPGIGVVNLFATRDTLKQVVEEYAANGTSGPFAVRNNSAVAGSEKVELITRDRNNRAVILAVEPLGRLTDYVFEPFSGRILLNRPVPSLDPQGHPVSIRITYEVDQGGDAFWLFGADAQVRLGSAVEVGGSAVEDRNDLAPYRLLSANLGVDLGQRTRITAEVARTEGRYNTGSGVDTNLTPGLATQSGDAAGNAYRLAIDHAGEKTRLRLYAGRSDREFDNPAASFNGGRGDAGVRASHQLGEAVTVFGEAVRSEDRVADGSRTGLQAGVAVKLSERLTVDAALKRMEEDGNPVSASAAIPGNPSSNVGTPNAPLTPSGGFFGTGADAINPDTGTTLLAPTTGTASAGAGRELDATTLQLGAQYQLNPRVRLSGEVEHDITGDDKRRLALGAGYQLAERSRLYARWEAQQGLASIYSLNPADKSSTFVFGADTTYAPGAQFYSEYRLRDALGDAQGAAYEGRQAHLANGLRNTWQTAPGLRFVTGAEHLRVLDGGGQQALALVGGVDYTAHPLWKAGTRLEYRRLQDDRRTPTVNEAQDSWLSTIALARKLHRDWTLLVRNYALLSTFDASGDRLQDRFQVGVAYRDTDTNRVNALGKVEFKLETDDSALPAAVVGTPAGASRREVVIVSTHADWHPSRPWWLTGRVAAKSVAETFSGQAVPRYSAYLLSGRVGYDVTERWDLGVLAAGLFSPQGNARQTALGVEVGYLVKTNLWLSGGFNVTGFSDRDLTGSEYTQQGAFIRLRFKFDEDLFRGREPATNRALDRPAGAQ